MPEQQNYDVMDVNVIADGAFTTGFAEGTSVSFEKDEDSFTYSVGSQGDVSISESHNKVGTITLTLQHTSPSVKYYRDLHNKKVMFPCYVVDANNSSAVKAGGTMARVLKSPGGERGNESSEVEVEIKVFDYKEE